VNRKRTRAGLASGLPVQERDATRKHSVTVRTVDLAASRFERLQGVPLKCLRFKAVRDRTGLSRSTIWRLERRGEFPKQRRISVNAVGWVEQEIDDWMLTRAAVS
jgi:prophage regulatory protein